ncbi:MAG: hypothetical protein LBH97_04955 [Treponema sp.]|nr:hypothetical protein [Treponema sp.]
MHAGGGYATLNARFYNFRKTQEDKVDFARNQLQRLLASVSNPEYINGKNAVITEDLIKQIVSRSTFSKEDEERMMAELMQKYNVMPSE